MVEVNKDFLSGYAYAVDDLGREGDHRDANWSAAYKYLKERLGTFEPEKPKEIAGIQVIFSAALAPGEVEFHHTDGRVDRFQVPST